MELTEKPQSGHEYAETLLAWLLPIKNSAAS